MNWLKLFQENIINIPTLTVYRLSIRSNACGWDIIPWILCIPLRLYWLRKYTEKRFPIGVFLYKVVLKGTLLAFSMYVLPYLVSNLWTDECWQRFIMVMLTSLLCSFLIIYYCGLDKNMRNHLIRTIQQRVGKLRSLIQH